MQAPQGKHTGTGVRGFDPDQLDAAAFRAGLRELDATHHTRRQGRDSQRMSGGFNIAINYAIVKRGTRRFGTTRD